jgi:3-oxo-5alpha-steroid 4-dehydrogenase
MNADRYHFIALGGLRADVNGRVLDHSDHPIAGLYAAGAVTAHLSKDGSEYASGLSLGPGSFFARRAGIHVALQARAGAVVGS